MATTLNLTRSFSTQKIAAQLMMGEIEDDPFISEFPPQYKDAFTVTWEQDGNPFGIMPPRGLDGEPETLEIPETKAFSIDPGFYGARSKLTEAQMATQRQPGTPGDPWNIGKFVMMVMGNLVQSAMPRIRGILIDLLTTGRFRVTDPSGGILHADSIEGYLTTQAFSPSITWSTSATAVPIFDMLGWQATLLAGRSVDFGSESKFYMNSLSIAEFLKILQLTNSIRLDGGNTANGLEKVNTVLNGYKLPQIVQYDGGYYPDLASARAQTGWIRQLPTRTAIWVGKHKSGEPVGNWQFTRSLAKETLPGGGVDERTDEYAAEEPISSGMYTLVRFDQMPPSVTCTAGFNGGPAFKHPESVAVVTWT